MFSIKKRNNLYVVYNPIYNQNSSLDSMFEEIEEYWVSGKKAVKHKVRKEKPGLN